MRELLRILQPASAHRFWMVLGIGLGVAVITANTLLMAVSGWFIASMAVAGTAKLSFNFFFPSAAIRLLAILRTVGRYGERLVTHEAAFRILASLRVWLFRRMIPLAPAGLEHYAAGDLSGRLRADVDALESIYLRIMAPLLTGLFSIALAGLFAVYFSRSAALVLVLLLLLAGLLLPLFVRKLAELPGRRCIELSGELRSQVTQGLQGAEELLLLGATEQQAVTVDRLSAALIAQQIRMGRLGGMTLAGVTAAAGLAMALVAGVLIPEVRQHLVSGPQLVMLLLFSAAAFEAVGPLSHSLQLIPSAQAAVRRIQELADAPPALPEPRQSATPASAAVVLREVSCGYGNGAPVLNRFSLSINAGERVAVVGPSGIGKSTLVELLLRFRAYSGSITIGGCELRDLDSATVSRWIAAVPQAPHLFNDTIRHNIMLGRVLADEQMTALLHDCCLNDWIATLPLGLDTQVGEAGCAVSGGEARRIALARALVDHPPILVLDEPTEGLDSVTEQLVVQRVAQRLAGTTVLVVTHRPQALALADRVIPIPFQGAIFVGSSSAPQCTACTPASPNSSPP